MYLIRLRKKRRALRKAAEKVDDIQIIEDSDYQEFEPSDFELSGEECDEESKDLTTKSLLHVVNNNLDKDFTDTSDCDDDIEDVIVRRSDENKMDDLDALPIPKPNIEKAPQNAPAVGG